MWGQEYERSSAGKRGDRVIKKLKLTNVGPAPSMELNFGDRLNVFTGDNGLGKSFLLDIVWWTLTRKWPSEINPLLTGGKTAIPSAQGKATIDFAFTSKTGKESYISTYNKRGQVWTGRSGRPANPGLVLYAMSDGSFAVWDPARNYWQKKGGMDIQERRPAYVFSPTEVWDGLLSESGTWLSNGLIRDWANWQKEAGATFRLLKKILKALSSSENEELCPGKLTRVNLEDARDMPTITMPYNQDVPVVHASSGMRRIIALSYFLVWAWEEHRQAAKQIGEKETRQVVFLIDEIESHLHPRWQRCIVPALLSAMDTLAKKNSVQLITATHSPIVMASMEPLFDEGIDAWFDLDFEAPDRVVLRHRFFEKLGEAENWLGSEAFDLKSTRSIEYEKLLDKASGLLRQNNPPQEAIKEMNDRLVEALNPKDRFLFNWRYIVQKKGWLP